MSAPYFDIVEERDGVVGQVVVHEVLGHLAEQTHFRQGEQVCQVCHLGILQQLTHRVNTDLNTYKLSPYFSSDISETE